MGATEAEPGGSGEEAARTERLFAGLRGLLEPALQDGERLEAVALGMRPRMLRTTTNAVGVTQGRLLIQPASPDWSPAGELVAYPAEAIEAFSSHGGRENYRHKRLLEQSTTIEIAPLGERKFRLVMMRGGSEALGEAGVRAQEEAIEAIIDWLAARVRL